MNQMQLKFKFYYDHILSQVYDEGTSAFHESVTHDLIERFIDPLQLTQDSRILDVGCGPGYFLDAMHERGFSDVTGLSVSSEDIAICKGKKHRVEERDINLLWDRDESVDMIWSRHSLEHSPFPYITLLEYNRVLRPNGVLFIEVPQPDCERNHENNKNHYSVLGKVMWFNLLQRSGFDFDWYEFEVPMRDLAIDQTFRERSYIFLCRRARPVDIK